MLFSAILAIAVLMCGGMLVFAFDGGTYTIDIPSGFKNIKQTSDDVYWENNDLTIVINMLVKENVDEEKLNPNDFDSYQMQTFENNIKKSFEQTYKGSEVISANSSVVELGKNDAVKVDIKMQYRGAFIYCSGYFFETQNYVHSLTIIGENDVSDFAYDVAKTIEIDDEPVELINDTRDKIHIISRVVTFVIIAAVIILVLVLIRKLSPRNSKTEYAYTPDDLFADGDKYKFPSKDSSDDN